jgi:hypothetical protein
MTSDFNSSGDPALSPDFDSISGSGFTGEFTGASGPGFTPDAVPETDYTDPYGWETMTGELDTNEEAYRFLKWGSIIQPSGSYSEDVIYINKLSQILPPLLLPEDLDVGQYLLVFQIIGKNGVINQIDKPFYYIGAAEFALDDIHAYLPGIFEKGHLVSPETPIMLETRLAAGPELTPYVVWYNGKKQIYEGYVSEGAARFIWQTPNQTGFYSLKVEAFPFKPLNTGVQTPTGKIKELSLPVAAKNENSPIAVRPRTGVSGLELIPVRHYPLFAEMKDSQSFIGDRNVLVPVNHTPEWLPRGAVFGLAVGPDHQFFIPGPLFTPAEETEGQLLFRFIPLTNGVIFSGSFNLKVRFEQEYPDAQREWFETFDMRLFYIDGTVRLRYSGGSVSDEQTIFLSAGQTEGVITAVIGFEVQNDTLRLSLGLNAPPRFPPDKGVPLPGPLTGDGIFRLGAVSEELGTKTGTAATHVAVVDEIAFLIVPDVSLNKTQPVSEISTRPDGSP